MTKLYALVGAGLLVWYLAMETRGVIFTGTDSRPSLSSRSRSGSGGGVFFFGTGYGGGK